MKKTSSISAFKVVQNVLPSRFEYSQWNEAKMISFIQFCKQFLVYEEKSKDHKWRFSAEQVAKANSYQDNSENEHFKEFAVRINETTGGNYFRKVSGMYQNFGTFLKMNPSFLTEKIENEIKDIKKLEWPVRGFKTVKMRTGHNVTLPNNTDMTMGFPQPVLQAPPDTELVLLNLQARVIDIYKHIVKSIKPKDIKKMDVDRKLHYIKELSAVINGKKIIKPNMFFNFNAANSSARDLEKGILGYALKQSEINKSNKPDKQDEQN